MKINKKIIYLAVLCFTLLFAGQAWGQNTGDYRSFTTGNWTTESTWKRWDGDSWETPTLVQGTPGEFTGTGAVTLISPHNITINAAITTQTMGNLTISNGATLTLTTDNPIIIYSINTPEINVISGGTISFSGNNKARLSLPTNASIIVTSGGLSGSCNANVEIYIGTQYSQCTGFIPDFAQLMASGGTINSVPTATSPICSGNTINLTGNYSGAIGSAPAYSWSVTAPSGGVSTHNTQNVTITNAVVGTYTAVLNVTTVINGNTYGNSETASVVVNANPTISTQPTPATQSVALNGTPSNLLVTGAAGSGTISKYEWYSNLSNSTTGGTLVATHTTTATTDTYTPATNVGGMLYYYCIITNSNNCTAKTTSTASVEVTGGETYFINPNIRIR
jgi:hypothetical protein